MGSCVLLDVKSGTLGGRFSHALALECEPVRIVHEPIEDSVGDGRIGDRQCDGATERSRHGRWANKGG